LRFLHDLTANANSKEKDVMGSPVGVFSNDEVKGLSKKDITLLKAHVVHHIQTSAEIRRILIADRKLLRKLTTDPRINKILRREAVALKQRLEKK
jgi:hypothetical protein